MRLLFILTILTMLIVPISAQMDPQTLIAAYNKNVDNLPGFVENNIGDENMHIFLKHSGGGTTEYAAITKDARIIDAMTWQDSNNNGNHDFWETKGISPTVNVYLQESALLKIAQSSDPFAELKKEWGNGIKFEGLNFGSQIKIFLMGLGMNFADLLGKPGTGKLKAGAVCKHGGECETGNCVKENAYGAFKCSCNPFKFVVKDPCPPQATEQKTNLKAGEVCQHGGECQTGNCVKENAYGAFKCSCDPFKFVVKDPCPSQPTDPKSGLAVGEVCQHGGQCQTGNCVGVGQGPPWVYKCSCNPFKFTTFGC